MKNPEQTRIEAAEEQAALWAARLDGSAMSSTDDAALKNWMESDPLNRDCLARYRHFDTGLGEALGALAAAGAPLRPEAPKKGRRPFLRSLLLSGAAVSAAAVFGFVFWPGSASAKSESYSTPAAQRRSLSLDDGTRVELNARTKLEVFHEAGIRRVSLCGGEAYFEVSKDPARPFVVETARGSVRVTGTVFDVDTDAKAGLVVTVVEGSVLVSPSDKGAVALAAGDRFANGGKSRLSELEMASALAWRSGMAVFNASPLSDAVASFARYHNRTIEVSRDAAELGVGGRFSLDDLDKFLAALQEMHPVTVVRSEDGSLRVRLRNEP